MLPSPKHAQCMHCRAYSNCRSPFLSMVAGYDSPATGGVLVIGENPSADEDYAGQLLSKKGSRTTLLRQALRNAGISLDECRYTVAVRCAPEKNKAPSIKSINACSHFLHGEIEEQRPVAILILGNTPLRALFKKSGITKLRRQVLDYRMTDGTIVPCVVSFSPSFVARDYNQRHRFTGDVKFFADTINGHTGIKKVPCLHNATETEMRNFAMKCKAHRKRPVAFDVETDELHLYTRTDWLMLCIGFSDGDTNLAVAFDSLATGRVSELTPTQQIALDLLADSRVPKVGHNVKFDMHAVNLRFGINVNNILADTLLMHTFVYPIQGGHDLGTVSMEELGIWDYKAETREFESSSNDPKKFALMPYNSLAERCTTDCYCTLKLYYKLTVKMRVMDRAQETDGMTRYEKPSQFFFATLMRTVPTLYQMEATGLAVDLHYLTRLESVLEHKTNELCEKLRELPKVQLFETALRNAAVKEHTAKIAAGKRAAASTLQRKLATCVFKPSSPHHVREIVYGTGYFNTSVVKRTNTGDGTTSADALAELCLLRDTPSALKRFVKRLTQFKELQKLNSTYVYGLRKHVGFDKRIHTTIRPNGTDTGRTSSSDPNLQNIPRLDAIRRMFVARLPNVVQDECVLVESDYSQLELRLAAAFSNDANMVSVYKEGRDLHTETAMTVFDIRDSTKVTKEQRVQCKAVNFGVIYGLTAMGLARNLTLQTGKTVSDDDAQVFIDGVFRAYPDLREWQIEQCAFAAKYGYVYTMFGSRRLVSNAMLKGNDFETARLRSEAERQAVNTPVQGTGGIFTLVALIRLNYECRHNKIMLKAKARIVLTVHDSITVECLKEYASDVADIVKRVMIETPLDLVGKHMNGVPIEVDSKIGDTWGTLK